MGRRRNGKAQNFCYVYHIDIKSISLVVLNYTKLTCATCFNYVTVNTKELTYIH